MLDTYLTASTPFREALEKAMVRTLEQLAMPTRADVVSIAERMTNIEMRLDDLDAKLDTIQRLITQAVGPPPQPRKVQQPAKKAVAAKKAKRGKK
jgi:hypothetical protein